MPRIPTRLTALLAAAAAALITGCAAAVVGGAAAGGALVATNRRSPNTQLSDQTIELRAAGHADRILGGEGHINVVSYYRKVLLTGEVPSEDARQRIQTAVAGTPEVAAVINEMAVMPASSLSARSNDTLITGRVKANLLHAAGVPSNSIKVVTERGTTYLMGRLTQKEAELATDAARSTNGVQRVVRIIDIISDEEARRVDNARKLDTKQEQKAPVSNAQDSASDAAAEVQEAAGAVTHPVSQPVMVKQPPESIDLEPLPPLE